MQRFIKNNKGTLLFIFLMLFFRTAVADWYHVPTGSMQPNILIGDRVWVNKLAYDVKVPFTEINLNRHAEPLSGDVVVFMSAKEKMRLVKRVIGLPGDQVEMINNQLIINHQPLAYSLASESDSTNSTDEQTEHFKHSNDPAKTQPNIKTKHYIEKSLARQYRVNMKIDTANNNDYFLSPVSSFDPVIVPKEHYLVLGDNRDNSRDSRFIGFIPRNELIGRAEKVLLSLDKNNYYLPRKNRFMTAL